jgi:hypothetical protein
VKPVILLDIEGVLNPTVCPGNGGDWPLLRVVAKSISEAAGSFAG